MATKKKSGKRTRSRAIDKKARSTKPAPKKQASKKLIAKKRKTAGTSKKTASRKRSQPRTTRTYTRKEGVAFEPESAGLRSGGQSGDLQGLRDVERADSESVDELLEEGNAFEADVVAGVERGEDNEEREVHTHEVPEDDVPEEYRDNDL